VDRFVTAGRPTSALRQAIGVVGITDVDPAAGFLFLEVTFQTERGVSLIQ